MRTVKEISDMFQLTDAASMVMEIATAYRTNKEIQMAQDSVYGQGTTEYIGQAMEAFYQETVQA